MATPTHSRTTYDRRAIMAAALADARALRSTMPLSWREALALALRSAWTAAKRRAENLLAAARIAASRSASRPAISC